MAKMSTAERALVRRILSEPEINLWDRYKSRVEDVRRALLNAGKNPGQATAAWKLVLAEEPYSSAMLGPDSAAAATKPEFSDGHADFTKKAAATTEERDETVAQGIEQSNREDMAWVAANLKREVKREDAPNDAAHNLYLWVKEGNADEFWKRFLAIAGSKEGQNADRMCDDGRPALEAVEALLEKDYGKKPATPEERQVA